MTRIEMVKRLLSEGLSRNTLVNFTDKQLLALCERMLGEQTMSSTIGPVDAVVPNSPNATKTLEKLKKAGVNAVIKENDKICAKCGMKDCKCKDKKHGNLKGNQTKLDANKNGKIDKEDFKLLKSKKEVKEELKGNQSKIDANKNGKIDKEDFKLLKNKKSVGKTEMKEGDKKWIQNAIHPSKKGSLKKALGVKKDETIPAGKLKAAANKGGKLGQRARMAMTLKKLKESEEVNQWVTNLAETNYHSFTSKGEIMGLIKTKLNEVETAAIPMPKSKPNRGHNGIPEFMSYDAITDSDTTTKPITKPDTKPTTKPTPFGPGTKENPGPSANTTTKPITKPDTKPTTKPTPFGPGTKENPGPSAINKKRK